MIRNKLVDFCNDQLMLLRKLGLQSPDHGQEQKYRVGSLQVFLEVRNSISRPQND